jgi:hypothetical protein
LLFIIFIINNTTIIIIIFVVVVVEWRSWGWFCGKDPLLRKVLLLRYDSKYPGNENSF